MDMTASLWSQVQKLPPPPEGYFYSYDFPRVEKNGNNWDITVDLCLEDREGRKIPII